MVKLITPNLAKHAFEMSPYKRDIEIAEQFQQSLSRIIGYDRASQLFRFIDVDSDGNIGIQAEGGRTSELSTSVATIGTSAGVILSENSNRKSFTIFNNSANLIYIGKTSSVSIATGFPLPSGAAYESTSYYGSLYGISASVGNDIRVLEIG